VLRADIPSPANFLRMSHNPPSRLSSMVMWYKHFAEKKGIALLHRVDKPPLYYDLAKIIGWSMNGLLCACTSKAWMRFDIGWMEDGKAIWHEQSFLLAKHAFVFDAGKHACCYRKCGGSPGKKILRGMLCNIPHTFTIPEFFKKARLLFERDVYFVELF